MAFLTPLFSLLGIIAKNPIVQKITIFSFFFGLVSYTVDFFLAKITVNISELNNILVLANWMGLMNALQIVLSIVISGFVAKQILAFIRS